MAQQNKKALAQQLTEMPESKKARAIGKRPSLFHTHVPSEDNDLLIETINNSNLTWKANECMLTKSHAKYNKEQCEDPEES